MPAADLNYPEAPILILAPMGSDANNAAAVLRKVNIHADICSTMEDLCRRSNNNTGALLVSEETLDTTALNCLVEFLGRQPAWSDIPLVLLTRAGEITQKVYNILNFLDARANITLLEKPLRAITLISVMRAALRSRHHQYKVRNLVESNTLAMEGAQMGSWDLNLRTQAVHRSLRHDQILGHDTLQGDWSLECFFRHVLEEDRAEVRKQFQNPRVGDALFFECRIRHPNQSIHWIAMQGRVYGDEKGAPNRIAGVITDITQRKEMEAAADVQRERLDLVLQSTAVGLWYWDIPEKRMTWNVRCKEHHGLAPEKTVSQESLMDQVHPEDREQMKKALAHSLEDGRDYDHEYRTVDRKWIRAIGQIFLDHAGKAVRFDGITMDVTKRKEEVELLRQAQQELSRTAEDLESRVKERTAKLEETVSEMEAFSYSVSHDLRSPLRAMQGYASCLLDKYQGQMDAEGQDYLKRISLAAERLDRLTQDLLTYSRVVRNPVVMRPIHLEEFLPEVLYQYPDFQPPTAEIVLRSPLGDVQGHEASLIQCVSNLISNAIKFVPAGTKPRITIHTEILRDIGAVKIWFEDNGIGIEQDQLNRIFGIFERVSKKYEGTGIGLAIVRKAAERMKGAVGVESVLGQGSKFWLQLPAVQA